MREMRKGVVLWIAVLALVFMGGLEVSAQRAGSKTGEPSLIMLVTDFGPSGYMLGALKGAIYKALPGARIDSITNDIKKFDIDEAAQTLVLASADYPAGTVFVVVVDPGLGRPRTPIALEAHNGQVFLGPDNGVLTQVAIRYRIKRVHQITNQEIIRANPEESTFLSRDVFGPAAAALAGGGVTVSMLGPEVKSIYLLTSSPAEIRDGMVYGTIRLVDGYGNVQTNITSAHLSEIGLKEGDLLEVGVGEKHFQVKWVKTYGDVKPKELLAKVGSHNEMMLAVNQGSLAEEMNLQKGEAVVLGKR